MAERNGRAPGNWQTHARTRTCTGTCMPAHTYTHSAHAHTQKHTHTPWAGCRYRGASASAQPRPGSLWRHGRGNERQLVAVRLSHHHYHDDITIGKEGEAGLLLGQRQVPLGASRPARAHHRHCHTSRDLATPHLALLHHTLAAVAPRSLPLRASLTHLQASAQAAAPHCPAPSLTPHAAPRVPTAGQASKRNRNGSDNEPCREGDIANTAVHAAAAALK